VIECATERELSALDASAPPVLFQIKSGSPYWRPCPRSWESAGVGDRLVAAAITREPVVVLDVHQRARLVVQHLIAGGRVDLPVPVRLSVPPTGS